MGCGAGAAGFIVRAGRTGLEWHPMRIRRGRRLSRPGIIRAMCSASCFLLHSAVERLLAVADRDATLSLLAQLGSMGVAAAVGRFLLKSRVFIFLVSVAGAAGAMWANMVVDGQGAFMMLAYAPVIYFVATVGRDDLDQASRPRKEL